MFLQNASFGAPGTQKLSEDLSKFDLIREEKN